MIYQIGDRVLIKAQNKTGTICDVDIFEGKEIVIVDCADECDSDEFEDCVVTVEASEVEML